MQTLDLELTPELRAAVLRSPDGIVVVTDKLTGKQYILLEQRAMPELEDEYVRRSLDMARDQIARGEISTATVAEVIAKARKQSSRQGM